MRMKVMRTAHHAHHSANQIRMPPRATQNLAHLALESQLADTTYSGLSQPLSNPNRMHTTAFTWTFFTLRLPKAEWGYSFNIKKLANKTTYRSLKARY